MAGNPFDQFDEVNPFDQFDQAAQGGVNWDDFTPIEPKKRVPVPDMSVGSIAQDIASGALQIGPTAFKGAANIARLITGDRVGKDTSEAMERGMGSIRDMVGSDRAAAQRANFQADMADDDVGIGETLARNKGALADQLLPIIGSMFLPVGVAGAAGKLATAGKAAQGMNAAALAARVAAVQKVAGIGTVAAQNAADTFAELLEKGVPMEDAYVGAGITVPFSVVAGVVTGGGAEGAITRALTGATAARAGIKQAGKAMAQEGGQEMGEEAGQIVGEAVGTGTAPSATSAAKQMAVAGTLGAVMGGGVDVANQAGQFRQEPEQQPAPTPAQPAPAAQAAAQPPAAAAPAVAPAQPTQTAAPAATSTPAADPVARLAELEIINEQRDLTPDERQEAAALLSRLDDEQDASQGTQGANGALTNEGASPQAAPDQAAENAAGNAPAASGVPAAGGNADVQAAGVEAAPVDADSRSVLPQAAGPAPTNFWSFAKSKGLTPGQIQVGSPEHQALKAEYDALRAGGSEPVLPSLQPPQDVNLQNRDRGRAASVVQMAEIARNPDYMRLGPSRTPDSGAPMVFAVGDDLGVIPTENFGREDMAVMSDGQRVPFRYAVVDATKVNPSNFADGRTNPDFSSGAPGVLKALNNGRTAGIRAAHEMGTAGEYVQGVQADAAMHGVSPEVVARTPNPMLVRIYADAENTAGMAAKSQGQGLGMSPAELARQDAPLLDASVLSAYQPGDVTSAANRDFVRAFVGRLNASGLDIAGMMTGDGQLSQDGRKRIQAALMQAAYGDSDIVEEMFDSTDTDIKAIGEALKTVAGQWANMRDSARLNAINPQTDITDNLLQAIGLIRKARRDGMSLYDLVNQPDLMTGETPAELTVGMLRLFYSGQYLTRAIGKEKLAQHLADYVQGAMTTSADAGMFGDVVTAGDILATIVNRLNEGQGNAEAQPQEGRGQPAGSVDTGRSPGEGQPGIGRPGPEEGGAGPDQDRGSEPGQNAPVGAQQQTGPGGEGSQEGDAADEGRPERGQQGGIAGEAGAVAGAPDGGGRGDPAPLLESYTPEELAAREDAQAAAERQRASAAAEAESRAQADAERDGFALTGSDRPADVLEAQGQTPMFSFAGARAATESVADAQEQGAMFSRAGNPDTEAQRQFKETERAYGGREAYDRAKAAGKTKLTYGQWVQVRTPNFKAWFGDWEAVRAQERLDSMKPMQVRVPDAWRGLGHAELRQKMAEELDRMVREKTQIEHPELGMIQVGRAGAKKTSGSARDPAKSLVAADIEALIPASIYARTEPSRGGDGPDIEGYSTLLARVDVDGVPLVASFTVRHQSDGQWYYNAVALHDGKEKAQDSYGRPDQQAGSRFAPIAGLSDFIRRPLARVNPEEVSKVVDSATGEPLVVYHGTNSDLSAFASDRANYFTADPGAASVYAEGFGAPREGANVSPVYLSIQRPKWMPLTDSAKLTAADLAAIKEEGFDGVFGWTLDTGMDGPTPIAREVGTGQRGMDKIVTEAIPLSPEQIKSATGNNGNFDARNPDIRYSRSNTGTMTAAAVNQVASTIAARWAQSPPVVVVQSMQDMRVPEAARLEDARQRAGGASGSPRGFYYRGQVFLVADGLTSVRDAAETLFHEALGHHGLRAMFGNTLDGILDQIAMARPDLMKPKAEEYGKDLKVQKQRREVAEEVLAEMAQTKPELGYVKRAIAAIRTWLRQNVPGFKDLQLTDAEIIRSYILPARGWVERGAQSAQPEIAMAFDRSAPAADQTQTKAFMRWFGDSKAVDASGKPLVVYHGTGADFSVFTRDRAGATSGAANAGMGFFFTDQPEVAGRYAAMSGGAQTVMPVYLSLQNPIRLTAKNMMEADRLLQSQMKPEHDGAIIEVAMRDGGVQTVFMAKESSQVKSSTGNNGDFDPANPDIRFSRSTLGNAPGPQPQNPTPLQRLKAKALQLTSPQAITSLIYEYQDKNIDLKRLRDHIKELGGTITDLNDAYLGEELYHKRVAKRTQDFLSEELKPLLADLRARGLDLPTLEQFLHARHAPEANKVLAERNPNAQMIDAGRKQAQQAVRALELQLQRAKAQGTATKAIEDALTEAREDASRWKGAQAFQGTEDERTSLSGMSDAAAKAFMDGLQPGQRVHLDALAARVDAINAKTLDTLEKYGLMDKASMDAWRNTYQHYVPLHRDEAHPDAVSHPIGQGFSTKGAASKRRTGSNEKVTNILAHIAMQRESALTRGEKNRVAKKLYLMAAQNPDPEVWAVDKPPMTKTVDSETGFVRTNVDPTYKNKPNVVMVRIGGKDQAIVFNERNPEAVRLAQSIKNQDVGDLGRVMRASARFTRFFAAMSTQYNPVFTVVNFVRDLQGGVINLSSTQIADRKRQVFMGIGPALRAIYADVRAERKGGTGPQNQWAQLWDEMQNEGGTTGYRDLFADPAERVKAIEKELAKIDRGDTARLVDWYVTGWVSDMNEAVENAVRLSAYKAARDSGMSKEQSASLAKNITVNFNRKGRLGAHANALYAFFNAAVQGNTRMLQTLSSPMGRKIILGGIALGVLNTMLMVSMLGGDGEDDEYKNLPEFVKSRNLMIPLGGKDYLTVPLPLGLHVLPNIGRLATEFAMGYHQDKGLGGVLGEVMTLVMDAFNPLGGSENVAMVIAPTPLDIPVGIAMNRDWQNRPIARENMSELDPEPAHKLTRDSATIFSKKASELLNAMGGGDEYTPGAKISQWTPDQIDYVVSQLTGGLGREMVKSLQTVNATMTGDELPDYKIPLWGRFKGSTEGPAGQSMQYSENVRKLNIVENSIKGRARDEAEGTLGSNKTAAEYMAGEPLSDLVGVGNAAERQIAKLRQYRASIQRRAEPGYQDEVKQINEQIAEVMTSLNREVNRVKKEAATN